MRFPASISIAALLFLAVGCASEKNVADAQAEDETFAADSYLSHKTQEVKTLERRVNDLSDMATDETRRYQGSHDNLRRLVSDQYDKLESAKADLEILKSDKGVNTIPLMTRLDDTLEDIRTTLNLMVAE